MQQQYVYRDESTKHSNCHILADRYRLDEYISKGSSGKVYKAYDMKLNKIWAIKALECRQKQEVEVMKQLDYPAFPRIVDCIWENDKTYIVMDYIEGKTLGEFCDKHNATQKMLMVWSVQIAEAIEYLHNFTPKMLYLDCKPDNIIIDGNNNIKLVDFGSIYICNCSDEQRISGTIGYASPELRNGGKVDVRSDIYSLGMTMYRMAVGDSGGYIFKNGLPAVDACNNSIDEHMRFVITKCCMPAPKDRYQNMRSLIDDINSGISKKSKRSISVRVIALFLKITLCITCVTLCKAYCIHDVIAYLAFAIAAFVIMLLIPIRTPYLSWDCDMDIFETLGKKTLPLVIIGVLTGCLANTITANASDGMDSRIGAYDISDMDVSLIDESGVNVLYYGQRVYCDGEDICIEIPYDSLDTSSLPCKARCKKK